MTYSIPGITAKNLTGAEGLESARVVITGDPGSGCGSDPYKQFNTAAFTVAPQFTIGSASRNPVRGPAYRDVDLALIRRVRIGPRYAIEVRAEIFNVLNTPPLGAPAAVLGAANFGTITTAGDPRVAQMAVKMVF